MTNDDLNILFICAFRYALGRSSYVVSEMCDLITANLDIFSDFTKKLFIKEITRALDTNNYGMEMDREYWIRLRTSLTS